MSRPNQTRLRQGKGVTEGDACACPFSLVEWMIRISVQAGMARGVTEGVHSEEHRPSTGARSASAASVLHSIHR
jgi:hypothetical protein